MKPNLKNMSSEQCHYNVLGISKDASADDVKRAYRKKALDAHPDKGGTAERISELNEAYGVLSDPDKRARYDQGEQVPTATPEDMREFLRNLFKSDPSQLFRGMFPSDDTPAPKPPQQRRVQRPQDIFFELNVSYKQLSTGCSKKLAVRRMRFCTTCGGNGVECDTLPPTCTHCNGRGNNVTTTRTFLGDSMQTHLCATCSGTGLHVEPDMPRCKACKGKRMVEERAVLNVTIEPGTPVGWQVCCSGEGNDSLLAVSGRGDVVLKVTASLPTSWKRHGQDLLYRLDIGLGECVSGYSFDLQHPAGHALHVSIPHVIVPTIAMDGELLSAWACPEQGMPGFHNEPAGRLVVVFHVIFPLTTLDISKESTLLFQSTHDAKHESTLLFIFEPVSREETTRLLQHFV